MKQPFKIDINTLYGLLIGVEKKLDALLTQQGKVIMTLADVTAAIAQLKADVAADATVEASAITLLNGITAQLATANAALAAALASNDPTAVAAAVSDLQTLHSNLTASTASLAAAVGVNTTTAVPPVAGSTPGATL